MIDRQKAVEVLYDLMNSDMLGGELEDELQDIANCIEAEENNLHLWDADDLDVAVMMVNPDTNDPDYERLVAKCDRIYKKYCFEPSRFEKDLAELKAADCYTEEE